MRLRLHRPDRFAADVLGVLHRGLRRRGMPHIAILLRSSGQLRDRGHRVVWAEHQLPDGQVPVGDRSLQRRPPCTGGPCGAPAPDSGVDGKSAGGEMDSSGEDTGG